MTVEIGNPTGRTARAASIPCPKESGNNRLQAVLEDANSKLASVVTDGRGRSAREILQRLLSGERAPGTSADERCGCGLVSELVLGCLLSVQQPRMPSGQSGLFP